VTDDRDDIWLDARERGDNVDHVPAERRDRYARLEKRIAEMPVNERAPDGWMERVLTQVRRPSPMALGTSPPGPAPELPRASARRARWLVAAPALAVAAIVVLVVIAVTTRSTGPDVSVVFAPSGTDKLLGPEHEAHRSDVLLVRANSDRFTAIRVYADHGKAIAGCEHCNVDGAIRVPLDVVDRAVTIVTFTGCTPPPASDETTDRADAEGLGCTVDVVATTPVH